MSNHVGKPSMFEGNTFFGATGTPSRRIALVMTRFEDWLPEPLTVATRMVKSLTEREAMQILYFQIRRSSSREKSPASLPGSHLYCPTVIGGFDFFRDRGAAGRGLQRQIRPAATKISRKSGLPTSCRSRPCPHHRA